MKNIDGLISMLTKSICLLSVLVLFACGEKGPPVPPVEKVGTITAPYDLKLTHKKNTIFLNWSHKTDLQGRNTAPEKFDVFMVKKAIDGCVGCPFKFKLAGSVAIPGKDFFIRVENGYNYYFRIQAVAGVDLKSPYSKTVQVEAK